MLHTHGDVLSFAEPEHPVAVGIDLFVEGSDAGGFGADEGVLGEAAEALRVPVGAAGDGADVVGCAADGGAIVVVQMNRFRAGAVIGLD